MSNTTTPPRSRDELTITIDRYELSLINVALAYYEANPTAARKLISKLEAQTESPAEPEAAPVELFDFRIGLRLFETGERSARIIRAATVDEAIDLARVGVWKDSTVASVSSVRA
jgi:plasmid stabilization system protein ParE